MADDSGLVVDALTKRFADVAALDGMSLAAGRGRLVGFLGPNGAGKTTTMRAVMGLLRPDGGEMAPENWSDGEARAFAVRLDGRAQATGLHRKGGDATLLLLFNAYHDLVTFTLPETVGGEAWTRLLDTNLPDSQDVESFGFGQPYEVTGRSLLMFVLKPEDTPGDAPTEMERSYQHVMQAFERANVEQVRFHLDEE